MLAPDPKMFLVSAQEYFAGERQELLLLLAFSLALALVCALAFWRADMFGRGVAAGLALVVLIGVSASTPLLLRDRQHLETLSAQPGTESMTAEAERIDRVIRNYPYYRYGYALVLLCALVMILWRPSDFVSGLACGLLVLVMTGLVVDHYSEARASRYSQALRQLVSG